MTQTREEYIEELKGELERLEKRQSENPSEYKARRIVILRDRLGLPSSTELNFVEPKKNA